MFGQNKIKSLFVFEILGRPPEHIKNTLEEFVNKLGEQKGVEIISKKIHEPKQVEDYGKTDEVFPKSPNPNPKPKGFEDKNAKDLFTTFAEVELSAENLNLIFNIVLNMLPSNVEIIEPEELRLNNFDLSFVLSDLATKLHKYDEIAKTIMLERNALINKINQMQLRINELEGGVNTENKNINNKEKKKSSKKEDKKKKSKS